MDALHARVQQQHTALWSIFETTDPRWLPERRSKMTRGEIIVLAEVLYEKLEAIHELAVWGMAKPEARFVEWTLAQSATGLAEGEREE